MRNAVAAHQANRIAHGFSAADGDELEASMGIREVFGQAIVGVDKTAIAHPVVVVHFTHVSAAVVVKEHHHHIAFFKAVFELSKPLKGRSAGISQKQPFLSRQFAAGQSSISVADFFKNIDHRKVYVFRQNVFANAFGDVGVDFVFVELSGFVILFKHRTVGVHTDDLNIGIALFEITTHPANGSSRADSDHKMSDSAFGLFPDFGAGGFVVRCSIAEVVVLIGKKTVRDLRVQAARHRIIAIGMIGRNGRRAHVDLGAHGSQNVHFLLALLVAQGADQFIALDHGGQCQAHTRVAAGAFDNGAARFEPAVALGVFDHFQGHSVFDAVARIEILHLGPDLGLDLCRYFVEFDHRGSADGVQNVGMDVECGHA